MAKTPIGEQIAQYRKAAGITQEELGRAVGVSTQAVSRWECGGTPDVELLPALADALGVSVDALFGRDGSERLNLDQLLARAIRQTPEDRRMGRVCDLVWVLQRAVFSAAIKEKGIDTMDDLLSGVECSDRSKAPHPGHTPWQFVLGDDSGFLLSGIVRDMRYALVLPEAPDGFAAMLKKPEDYLRLFELLSMPHCLDMLIGICCRKPRETFTDRLAAART
nr:helix-turn-helix transcriptional regulator [Clostridia bacterium]